MARTSRRRQRSHAWRPHRSRLLVATRQLLEAPSPEVLLGVRPSDHPQRVRGRRRQRHPRFESHSNNATVRIRPCQPPACGGCRPVQERFLSTATVKQGVASPWSRRAYCSGARAFVDPPRIGSGDRLPDVVDVPARGASRLSAIQVAPSARMGRSTASRSALDGSLSTEHR